MLSHIKVSDENFLELLVSFKDKIDRLDLYISNRVSFLSRSAVVKMIDIGSILVNGKIRKKNYIPLLGDRILINLDGFCRRSNDYVVATEIPIEIIFEDEFLMVINKQKGLVTHPAPGHYDDTLVNALLCHGKKLSNINGSFRPGIVHRLDKDTSGILLIAKDNFVHENLANQIKNKTAKREYLGVIHGNFKFLCGTINLPIGRDKHNRKKMAVTTLNSRDAVTNYRTLKNFKKYSLVKFSLETGRTHQIRVHSSYMGHPIAGDSLYGAKNDPEFLSGQCLHAMKIKFQHPITQKIMEFSANLPNYFQRFLSFLSKN